MMIRVDDDDQTCERHSERSRSNQLSEEKKIANPSWHWSEHEKRFK